MARVTGRPTGRPRKNYTREDHLAVDRAYNARRDPEKMRVYHREYQRRMRALAKLAIEAGLELPLKSYSRYAHISALAKLAIEAGLELPPNS